MASGVTYQALSRLTWLFGRDAADNGSIIAAQPYDDVQFIGGNISNVTLTNATINGIIYAPNTRYITAAGSVTVLTTDNTIFLNKTIGAATAVSLPAIPAAKQLVIIKDAKGDANTHNITISGNGNTIDGGSSYVIGSIYGAIQLLWNSVEWSIIA